MSPAPNTVRDTEVLLLLPGPYPESHSFVLDLPKPHEPKTTGTSDMPPTRTPPPVPKYPFAGWCTSIGDGYSHAVTEAAFCAGMRVRRGQFHAVCGQVICLAASVARPAANRALTAPRSCGHTPPRTLQTTRSRYLQGAT